MPSRLYLTGIAIILSGCSGLSTSLPSGSVIQERLVVCPLEPLPPPEKICPLETLQESKTLRDLYRLQHRSQYNWQVCQESLKSLYRQDQECRKKYQELNEGKNHDG